MTEAKTKSKLPEGHITPDGQRFVDYVASEDGAHIANDRPSTLDEQVEFYAADVASQVLGMVPAAKGVTAEVKGNTITLTLSA